MKNPAASNSPSHQIKICNLWKISRKIT
ncbi:MAG: hypothetical protein Athens071425_602, partial [Parcubacteria group bacterium Athens0714_25]